MVQGFSFVFYGAIAILVSGSSSATTGTRKCYHCASSNAEQIVGDGRLLGLKQIPAFHSLCSFPVDFIGLHDVPEVQCDSACAELFIALPGSEEDTIFVRGCLDKLVDGGVKQVQPSCEDGVFNVPGFPKSAIQQKLCDKNLCNRNWFAVDDCRDANVSEPVDCDHCSIAGSRGVDCDENRKCSGNWCIDRTTVDETGMYRRVKGCSSFNPHQQAGCYSPLGQKFPRHCWFRKSSTGAPTTEATPTTAPAVATTATQQQSTQAAASTAAAGTSEVPQTTATETTVEATTIPATTAAASTELPATSSAAAAATTVAATTPEVATTVAAATTEAATSVAATTAAVLPAETTAAPTSAPETTAEPKTTQAPSSASAVVSGWRVLAALSTVAIIFAGNH